MVEKLLKGLGFETLDLNPLKDIGRLSRILYTTHEESGALCIPMTYEREPIHILTLQVYGEYGLRSEFVNACLDEVSNENKVRLTRKHAANRRIRPCIEAAIHKHLDGEKGHLMRLGVSVECLSRGLSIPEIIQLFRNQADFNESKTRCFVEDAQTKRHKPFKCRTIADLGFCLGDSCSLIRKRGACIVWFESKGD